MDIRDFTFGVAGIEEYMHTPEEPSESSRHGERKIKQLWGRTRGSLLDRTTWSAERIDQFQFERVRAIVDTAYATHPFYHRLYSAVGYRSGDITSWEDYESLPVISKDDIIAHPDEFFNHLKVPSEQLHQANTSGSSGKILSIFQDEATSQISYLYEFRFYEQMLQRAREKLDWLYEVYLIPRRSSSFDGDFPVFTVSQNTPLEVVLEHMQRLNPTMLTGFASYFLRMADSGFDCTQFRLEAISTNSEPSTRGERDKISEAFGAPVFDEYSSEELWLIATECHEKKYHVVQDNVKVDVINPDGNGVGDIIATSLTNTYMPFIRYRQGDLGKLAEPGHSCSCPNGFHVLEKFHGRSNQTLVGINGEPLAPDIVMGVYDNWLLNPEAGISQFHIFQDARDHLTVYIEKRPGREIFKPRMEAFMQELHALFDGQAKVDVKDFSEIPPSLSHKRRVVSSTVTPIRQAPDLER